MSRISLTIFSICLFFQTVNNVCAQTAVATENIQSAQSADSPLRNEDILEMVKGSVPLETILLKLKSSKSTFELSPQKLQELKNGGVPDSVVVAMLEATQLPLADRPIVRTAPVRKELQIPDGTLVEIEAPYTISSLHFKPGSEISFRVVNPIIVDGVTLIEQGATATGKIEQSKRGGHWGKAGLLTWSMQTVTGADGTQIPLRVVSMRLRGDSKGAKVATGMIITGALMPLIAPVALLHGFKRGGDAYIPAGQRYEVFVNGIAAVKGRVQ